MATTWRIEPAEPGYPALLRVIPSAPPLWGRGTLVEDDALAVAIVGSRKATPYGLEVAETLAAELAPRGVTIVSGLARGIDSAAHRGALAAGGRTLAVLGCGIDRVYPPENRELAADVAAHGAVLSHFPPGTAPLAENFPMRNRVIAGLALAVVVVEAAEKSGALITASIAADLGREVLAVPGRITSPTSVGANALVRDGAKLVQHWSDIVQELPEPWRSAIGDFTPCTLARPAATSDEGRMLELLKVDEAQDIDGLIARAGMDAARVSAALTALALAGWARQLAGQRWIGAGARPGRG